jgi:hypothetical protein
MSLKFGIYLVEQRIISPEQFCGLVKLQQESASSLATIAIRRNFMTIKQVARVLEMMELNPSRPFLQVAMEERIIDAADSERLLHEQINSCPTLRKLLVECSLLTQHQTEVLHNHFEKLAAAGIKGQLPLQESATPAQSANTPFAPPQPKFSQRPVVVKSHISTQPAN